MHNNETDPKEGDEELPTEVAGTEEVAEDPEKD